MPIIKCPVCNKRMVTDKILAAHTKLRHSDVSEKPAEEAVKEEAENQDQAIREVLVEGTEVKTETPTVEESPSTGTAEAKSIEETPVVPVESDFVILRSADKRKLELSIGSQVWNDFEIKVPKTMAQTARRSLEEGGFFLHD